MLQQQKETDDSLSGRVRAVMDVVTFFGSIASITGISLLWLKGSGPIGSVEIARTLVAVVLIFGFGVFAIAGINEVYIRWTHSYTIRSIWKLAYFSFAVPLILLFLAALGHPLILASQAMVESGLTRVPYSTIVKERHGWDPPVQK